MDLHLKIATIHYPPFIFQDQEKGSVYGIEPSLLHILAEKLNFTFEYIFAAPDEMWGEILDFGNGNVTFTGILGMLQRREADIALANYYVDYNRKKYIDFTQPYGISHECFMVPVPRPNPKWTALYGPFQWPVWIATFLSFTFAALILRLGAKQRNSTLSTFNDIYICFLFVLGHVLGIHQNHQGIRSSTSRFLFIIWLMCTFVIATIYRSELISYMTSPYTPPPVDTIQQLVDSSLGKIAYGNFVRNILLSSDISLLKQIGQQMIVTYNFTYFLQFFFDYEIQKLLESGLIEYHRSKFAKKSIEIKNSAAKRNTSVEPLSLNDLQGAFYLLIVGFLFSLLCFGMERFTYSFNKLWFDYKKRKTNNIQK